MATIYDGETCLLCRNLSGKITPAKHKVSEEYDPAGKGVWGISHPPTAYLCEECFKLVMFAQRIVYVPEDSE